jgi:hypothetical protein
VSMHALASCNRPNRCAALRVIRQRTWPREVRDAGSIIVGNRKSCRCSDGAAPKQHGLLAERAPGPSDRKLYGTTQYGGGATGERDGCGTVFKVEISNHENRDREDG